MKDLWIIVLIVGGLFTVALAVEDLPKDLPAELGGAP